MLGVEEYIKNYLRATTAVIVGERKLSTTTGKSITVKENKNSVCHGGER